MAVLRRAGPVEQAITDRSLSVNVAGKEWMIGYGNFDLTIDTLESGIATDPYIAGDRFTAADAYVGAQIG